MLAAAHGGTQRFQHNPSQWRAPWRGLVPAEMPAAFAYLQKFHWRTLALQVVGSENKVIEGIRAQVYQLDRAGLAFVLVEHILGIERAQESVHARQAKAVLLHAVHTCNSQRRVGFLDQQPSVGQKEAGVNLGKTAHIAVGSRRRLGRCKPGAPAALKAPAPFYRACRARETGLSPRYRQAPQSAWAGPHTAAKPEHRRPGGLHRPASGGQPAKCRVKQRDKTVDGRYSHVVPEYSRLCAHPQPNQHNF